MANVAAEKKLKELIVYISSKCSEDIKYGKTKLNKILFYSDFLFYFKKQKSITDVKYRRLPYGPVPDDIDRLIKKMKNQDIAIALSNAGPYQREKIVALREADLSLFDAEMIAYVDSIINAVCAKKKSLSATQLSELSHGEMGWVVTSNGKEIPYNTVFLKSKKYQVATEWEKSRASKLANKFAGQYGYPTAT